MCVAVERAIKQGRLARTGDDCDYRRRRYTAPRVRVIVVYATRGLAEALLTIARERAPASVTMPLATTPAGELDAEIPPEESDGDLPPETPVFTDFYLPEVGNSVSAVFGVDLGTPAGQTQGRFVSHPEGRLELLRTDDLHEVVFVATPPWERESLAAFDRRGRRLALELVEAEPPGEFIA